MSERAMKSGSGDQPAPDNSPQSVEEDLIYTDFLNELLNATSPSKLPDNDDVNEDPDFNETLTDENADPDEDDLKIQVTKREAVALMRATYEFYEDDITSMLLPTKSFGSSAANANDLVELSDYFTTSNNRQQPQRPIRRMRFNNEIERTLYGNNGNNNNNNTQSSSSTVSDTMQTELFDYSRLNASNLINANSNNNINQQNNQHDFLSNSSYMLQTSSSAANILDQTTINLNNAYVNNNNQQQQQQQQQIQANYENINLSNNSSSDVVTPKPSNSNSSLNSNQTNSEKSTKESSTVVVHEYVPEFTELQRKRLDEQLRNHVQLLTQTCLASYQINETIFDSAHNLLKILNKLSNDGLNNKDLNNFSSESSSAAAATNDGNEEPKLKLSESYKIVNLKDSLKLIDDIKSTPKEQIFGSTHDPSNGLPSKFIDLIVNSPVFYNIYLIPKSRYKYQSQFKRSQFLDSEKILLIMGYEKFKHLPKDECCRCIKDHLLPNRSKEEIKKQLSSISNSKQRQTNLKDLLDKQGSDRKLTTLNSNYDFIREIHYKSPLEQSDSVELPSMYTITIERFKMSSILKETKELLCERNNSSRCSRMSLSAVSVQRHQRTPSCLSNQSVINQNNNNDDELLNSSNLQDESFMAGSDPIMPPPTTESSPSDERIDNANANSSKRARMDLLADDGDHQTSPSNTERQNNKILNVLLNSTMNDTPINSNVISIDHLATSIQRQQQTTATTTTVTASKKPTKIRTNSIRMLSNENLGRSVMTVSPSPQHSNAAGASNQNNQQSDGSSSSPSSSCSKLIKQNSGLNLIQANTQQLLAINSTMNHHLGPQQAPILIPPNFAGTILYQPIIHVHTTPENCNRLLDENLRKYRQIIPKKSSTNTSSSLPTVINNSLSSQNRNK